MIREPILFRPFFSLLLLLLFSPFCTYEPTSQIHPSFAIQALKAGHTSREIEKAIRKVRLTNKKASADPENEALNHAAVNALDELRSMGDTGDTGL